VGLLFARLRFEHPDAVVVAFHLHTSSVAIGA
jgi:hypothetical protein